ncbi:MAG: PAS domain-containing protein, partial [Myxococcales bacterium]|nr:PAS domain-containing protein [Myxococcales bacterium]
LPPSVLLDGHHQVVHSFGEIATVLRLPRGRPSLSLLDMLEGELKLAVAGALHRAARSRAAVSFLGVLSNERHFDVRVTPLDVPRMNEPFFLVSLARAAEAPKLPESPEPLDLDEIARDRLDALELELRHTKENLQATIEELEASNEELQATNEEMLASNEELQSTNEELHSVNEELYTVNTEYQHKIDELTELTDDMDNLLLSTEVHTLFLDDHLCIRKFTPAMAVVFNLLESDVGRRIDGFVHSIAIDNLGEILARTRDTGERFQAEVESRIGPYLMRVLPYQGRNGPAGVVMTLIDITALRKAEQALREQVVLRDRFLAMLSHELRNPLAAVNNALTLLGRRLPVDQEALRRPLELIERQSRHMQRLLDDLLDVSRITQGKIHLRLEAFDLRQVAREAIEHLQAAIRERRQVLDFDPGECGLWIRGDNTRILQVFDNLLTNASKYTPEGGHIHFSLGIEDDRAVIRVRDDGAGIDEQTQAHIFDMFVQAETTLDRSQGGLGVGLTLVHNIIELHGGSIRVHSPGVGQGSVFTIRLPTIAQPK